MASKRYIDLVYHRSIADLKNEAAKAYLGFIWWILDPILYLAIFYVIFELVFQRGGEDFVPFLLCGLVFWRWFDSTVRLSANSIQGARGIIGQVYVPKILLPCSVVLTNLIKFLVILCVFFGFVVIYGFEPSLAWLGMPLVMFIQLLLIIGASWLVAGVVPFIPDLMQVISYGMTMMFFMSGIFFDINKLDAQLQFYFSFNPMVCVIDAYRKILLQGVLPEWGDFVYVVVLSLAMMLVGFIIIKRFDRYYPRLVS